VRSFEAASCESVERRSCLGSGQKLKKEKKKKKKKKKEKKPPRERRRLITSLSVFKEVPDAPHQRGQNFEFAVTATFFSHKKKVARGGVRTIW
jgi:hypothetical protein